MRVNGVSGEFFRSDIRFESQLTWFRLRSGMEEDENRD